MLGASVALMDGESAQVLLGRMRTNSSIRLQQALDQARRQLEASKFGGLDLGNALNIIRWNVRRELRALASVASLVKNDAALAARLDKVSGELSRQQSAMEEAVNGFYRDSCQRRGQEVLPVPGAHCGRKGSSGPRSGAEFGLPWSHRWSM